MTADDLFSRATAPLRMLQRVWRDRRGNVLMIAGFAMLPLTFATGMGIDYSRAMRLETKLASVADAASLAAVTQPMMEKPFLTACDAARRTFVSQVSGLEGLTLDVTRRSDFTIRITDTYASLPAATLTCSDLPLTLFDIGTIPLTRSARVTFRGTSSNSFAGVLGIRTLTVKGTSTSRTVKAPYIDIHMALDTSQSMGLAATDQAAKDLWYWTGRLNGRSCQFGCHERDPKENYANEFIANYFKIPLRVNVLRDATTDMIDTAAAGQGAATNYQFALYRIGMNNGRYATGVDEYVKLTTDLTTLRSKVQTLSLSPDDGAVGFGDTDLPNTTTFVLPYIKATSTAVDDGTTQARARKFFFLITDGVTDLEGSGCTFGHCTKPMDPATCDAYKQKGITVGVVYTTFLPTKADPTNPANPALRDEYIKLVQPIATKIAPALQSCASPGWYFEASDGPTIHAAMQKLFTQASKQATIIQ